jgi:hypothetical protein
MADRQLTGGAYRRRRAAILASASVCGICSQRRCPHCDGDVCGNRFTHLDHDTPRSKGGAADASNEQAAHRCCNLKKGNRESTEILRTSKEW